MAGHVWKKALPVLCIPDYAQDLVWTSEYDGSFPRLACRWRKCSTPQYRLTASSTARGWKGGAGTCQHAVRLRSTIFWKLMIASNAQHSAATAVQPDNSSKPCWLSRQVNWMTSAAHLAQREGVGQGPLQCAATVLPGGSVPLHHLGVPDQALHHSLPLPCTTLQDHQSRPVQITLLQARRAPTSQNTPAMA